MIRKIIDNTIGWLFVIPAQILVEINGLINMIVLKMFPNNIYMAWKIKWANRLFEMAKEKTK